MDQTVRKGIFLIGVAILLFFLVTLVSNLAQLADVADRLMPGSGSPLLVVSLVVFAILLITPVVIYYRLPPALIPPLENDSHEFDVYMFDLKRSLRENPKLEGNPISNDEELQIALATLSQEASNEIKNTASVVFVSTAVMQNGRLDGLIVLASQLRMVLRIARIYYQRPSPRQILYLYSNVGTNVLVADSLSEVDFAEIVTPIMTSLVPSLKGAVPGLQGISQLLVNSLANGAANAFMTLRIGIIAQAYCSATCQPEGSKVRYGATRAALSLCNDIAKEQGSQIVSRAWELVSGGVGKAVDTAIDATREAAAAVATSSAEGVRAAGDVLGRGWDRISGAAGTLSKKPAPES